MNINTKSIKIISNLIIQPFSYAIFLPICIYIYIYIYIYIFEKIAVVYEKVLTHISSSLIPLIPLMNVTIRWVNLKTVVTREQSMPNFLINEHFVIP